MPYGLTAAGFIPKTIEIIDAEVSARIRAEYGVSFNVTSGIAGRMKAIWVEREALIWELMEAIVSSQDPDAATGAALDALCALTGTTRLGASFSAVTLTLTGTPTTLVGSGARARTVSTGQLFATQAAATLVLAPAWTTATVYALGTRVTASSRIYQCITAGTSGGAAPSTTSLDYTDGGGVHWRYLGEGTGVVDVTAAATVTGPIEAVSGDLAIIDTPTGGWSSVTNLLDASVGADLETDAALRLRRVQELARPGTGTVPAIRAALADVEDVTAATVFYNNTDLTDVDGVPPHAVECLVRGGADQDILQALFDNVAAGIKTHGSGTIVSGTVTDSQGTGHTLTFSRPTEVLIKAALTVLYDATLYPTDGDAQIKAAIVAWGDAQATGKNAVAAAVAAQAFTVPGVLDVTVCYISINPTVPVASTTIPISLRQLAVYDTGRISVTSSGATP